MKKASIIIPAYNEEDMIGRMLESYGSYFKKLKNEKKIDFEIIVVINNTVDRTEEIVKNFQHKFSEIRFLNFKKGGKGFAITQGFRDALKRDAGLLGFVDADHSTPPHSFYDLIQNIGQYDGIMANRWDARSKFSSPLKRRILSRGYNLIVRALFLFPYVDTQCGAKLFKREIIQRRIGLMASSHWNYDVALLLCLKHAGASIVSIPTEWGDSSASTLNLKKAPIMMLLALVRLRIIHSPFRKVMEIYDSLPEWIKFHHQIGTTTKQRS